MLPVEFYFDFTCPWSYLAFVRLSETALRTGADIEWRPVRVAAVLERLHPGRPVGREPGDPRKAAHEVRDLESWADYVGLRIDRPEHWPADASAAATGALRAIRDGRAAAYCDALFAGYFGLGLDIAEPGVVADLAHEAGCERDAVLREIAAPAAAASIRAYEERLLERGGFGTPTMFVGEQMFFGNDRMPLVEFALGQTSGQTFVMPGQHG